MSPARALSFFACLLLPCSGCVFDPAAGPPLLLAPTTAPGDAPPAPVAAAGTGPIVRKPVQLFVEQSEGAETARVRALLEAAEPRVGECVPGSGGVLRLRLASGPDGARFTIEPSSVEGRASPLGPRERRCVLEALSTVDVVSPTADASPSARPSGFTALFRIEW